MKKFSKLISTLLVVMLVFTACSKGNQDVTTNTNLEKESKTQKKEVKNEDKPVEITFMNYSSSGANEDNLQKMIDAFTDKNPNIKVKVLTYGFGDYFQQLATNVAGGTFADVFELNIENFRAYANKGVISPFENVDTSKVHPTTLEAFKVDGIQYGLPTKFSNVVMIYNKDLFDKAGVEYPNKDWTWEDELKAAQKIRELGDDYFGVYRAIQTWEFYKTVAQNGGSMMNKEQTEFTLNSVENIEALTNMIDRINKYNVTPNKDQMGGMGDWDLFKSGRLGMLVTGIWAFPDFTENCDFNWDIVVEPGMKQKATHFFSDAIVVSDNSENKEAAMKFAAFISGSDEAAKIRLEANWDLPVALTDEVKGIYLKTTPPDNKQAVIDSLEYLVMPPSLENFNQVADILGGYLEQALAGNMSPKEALDKAQEEISSKFELK